jgi:hypothetical protein
MKVLFQFSENKRMHAPRAGTAPQQVDAPVSQFSGAGARQQETDTPVFDEIMNFIQQNRELLDFIDDHNPVVIRQFLTKPLRGTTQFQKDVGLKKIITLAVTQRLLNQGGFSRLPGAEKEMRFIFKHFR